jgi:hypothetical protein
LPFERVEKILVDIVDPFLDPKGHVLVKKLDGFTALLDLEQIHKEGVFGDLHKENDLLNDVVLFAVFKG